MPGATWAFFPGQGRILDEIAPSLLYRQDAKVLGTTSSQSSPEQVAAGQRRKPGVEIGHGEEGGWVGHGVNNGAPLPANGSQ